MEEPRQQQLVVTSAETSCVTNIAVLRKKEFVQQPIYLKQSFAVEQNMITLNT